MTFLNICLVNVYPVLKYALFCCVQFVIMLINLQHRVQHVSTIESYVCHSVCVCLSNVVLCFQLYSTVMHSSLDCRSVVIVLCSIFSFFSFVLKLPFPKIFPR